ncbi:thymic stromal cotransporter homolog [Myripristis murdjan]|uniref:Solute carrier family 46 member 2 n=1 Tax=Myripristis murdjan TaxID=586833 RepID=A0A667WF70_9TELE|nr:thymic stromal cotransporter homolog [Myripristis murdjan]
MSRCGTLLALLRRPEPVVVVHQLAGALFDTALLMVVKDRCANATTAGGSVSSSGDDEQQKAMSDFYMKYNIIMKLVPIVPALLLARLGDRGWRKAPVLSPLLGYLLSRLALLLVVVLRAPLELMFAGAALYGLTGGFCSFWAGIQTLVSLGSAASRRSKAMMTVELLYGLAALLGSLASGHLFQLHSSGVARGTILVGISIALYLTCLLHIAFLLQVKQVSDSEQDDGRGLIADGTAGVSVEAPRGNNWLNVALLFAGGVLYDVAVGGAMQILVIFEVKEPLSWNATQVGYGNAAGYVIFLTSFFGVMLLSRWLSDVSLVLLGMLSFASGIFFMSFVTTTSMFYLARSLTLFALIPVPTIRSLLSQQVQGSSYGVTLLSLQLAFKLAGLAYTPSYTRIYQTSLDWFPGFVFMLSSIITVLGTVPISVLGCRLPQQRRYQRIQGD